MAAPNRSRRAVRAAILAVVIFVVGDVLVGFGTADQSIEPELTPPPAEFGTPAPAVGDRVEYQTTRFQIEDDGSRTSLGGPARWSHEWNGQDEVLDAEGDPVRVLVVDRGPAESDWELLVDMSSGERIAVRDDFAEVSQSSDPLLPPTPLMWQESENESGEGWAYWPPLEWSHAHPLACGLLHDLQGRIVPIDAPVALLPPACDILGAKMYLDARDRPLFSASAQEQVGDDVRVLFEADNVTLWAGPAEARIWLQEDVPYPVRMEFEYKEGTSLIVEELASWRAGDEPLESGPSTLEPAPELDFAPVQPWGIDDRGVEHPFPLSQAYQRALHDTQYSGLRDFLADHPDAFVVRALYDEFLSDNEVSRRWSIHLADDRDYLVFFSLQMVRPYAGSLIPALGQELPEAPIVYRAETSDQDGYVVDSSRRPHQLPTAISLLDRAKAYHVAMNVTGSLNAYGFVIPADDERAVEYHAGIVRTSMTRYPIGEVPIYSWDAEREWSRAWFSAEGRATGVGKRLAHEHQRVESESANPVSPTQGGGHAPLGESVETVSTWEPPGPRVLASLGLAAFSIGAIYYLWPSGQGFVVGLFSRLRKDKAFAHGQRAAIEEALRAEPGLHSVELARRLAVSRGALDHHLAQLTQAGLVTSVSSGRYRCYFLVGSADRRVMDATPVLKAHGARALLAAIGAAPGRSLSELAVATGLSSSTVNHHVERLARVGLVERRREGRTVAHFATDLGRRLA